MSNLKLNEILWEITGLCNKNCEFCGSADSEKGELNMNDMIRVAKNIADYGIDSITLSGGEPGTLSYCTLDAIIDVLRIGIKEVKVVTNGTILEDKEKAELFDRVGLSVNYASEIESMEKKVRNSPVPITMITNFGSHNYFDLESLKDFALKMRTIKPNFFWQVQLTVGKFQLPTNGIKELWSRLQENAYTVFADNLQETHTCGAGINGCSVLWNGNVIACLSERSYSSPILCYGNLLNRALEDIWENGFKDIRFGRKCHKHCRDCFKYPSTLPIIDMSKVPSPIPCIYEPSSPLDNYPHVVMYGVFPSNTMIYGVAGGSKTTFE